MNTIYTEAGHQTTTKEEGLSIRYNKKINTVAISGNSTELEVFTAYHNLINVVECHFQERNQLNCYFNFSVINTTTTKALFKLFRKLVKAQAGGNKVEIFWVIDECDKELIDVGLDFKNLYNLNFHIKVK